MTHINGAKQGHTIRYFRDENKIEITWNNEPDEVQKRNLRVIFEGREITEDEMLAIELGRKVVNWMKHKAYEQ